MNILNKVTWQAMWKNKTRTIVTIIGIILSAAMFTAVTTLGFSLWSYMVDVQVQGDGDYFLRYDYTSDAHLEELRSDDRISNLGDLEILGFTTVTLEREDGYVLEETCLVAAGDENFYDMVTVNLEEGRLPQTSSEIVITRNIYHYLLDNGISCEIGDTIELSVAPAYTGTENAFQIEIPTEGESFTKEYTVVGISETFTRLNDFTVYMSHLFTFADGNQGDAVWHRAYVKTANPFDARKMVNEAPAGVIANDNEGLLAMYGATGYANYNTLIVAVCAVLIGIIMVGSVSLIYNAFSISVSERTRQFGLLSSIGATRKQLRRSICFEALVLSGIGIPLGILAGYCGISVTLKLLGSAAYALFGALDTGVGMQAVPSPIAFFTAGAVALVTVLISARIPAKRATRISPLNAIRQTQDYQIPRRGFRPEKLTARLFGLPGMLASKYYTVSKRKYRATIVSLTISIVLFLSAFTVGQSLRIFKERNADTSSFDMMLYYVSQEEIEAVREQPSVSDSAVWINRSYVVETPREVLTEEYLEDCQRINAHRDVPMGAKRLSVYYLEDEVFLEYLESQNIDPESYFDEDCPTALVTKSRTVDYEYDAEKDIQNKIIYLSDVFADGSDELALYPGTCPEEVTRYIQDRIGSGWADLTGDGGVFYSFYYTTQTENTMEISDERLVVQVLREEQADGSIRFSYHLYDPETGVREESPIHTHTETFPSLRLGASIEELPYGIKSSSMSNDSAVMLILPLSAAGNTEEDYHYLAVSVNDRNAFLDFVDSWPDGFEISDNQLSELQYRNLEMTLDVFSYGFIILISLICVANVFNTISTNIALRRRDFGMLRSAGMKTGDIYRMMNFECLIYGSRALLWGLPVGTALSYGVQYIFRETFMGEYAPPWAAIAIVSICVFVVVFASMFYAVTKLRKDNPIEAIRMENI